MKGTVRRVTCVLFAWSCMTAIAMTPEDDPPTEPAFMPDRVYQVFNPDSIDLSTGTLSLAIPIGQRYPVGGGFSYGLVLNYNSNIWEYDLWVETGDCEDLAGPECERRRQAFPNKHGNAGLGWQLSLGSLYAPLDPRNPMHPHWIYVGPDGAQHRLWEKMYPRIEEVSTSGDHSFWYSRDGSYLRMKFRTVPSFPETRWVEFPDGTKHEFQEYKKNRFRLTRMEDGNGNWVTVDYYVRIMSREWRLTDQHGRAQKIIFVSHNMDNESIDVVSSIELTAFDGQTAVYDFNYTDTTIDRSGKDTDDETTPTLDVPLLTEIVLPDSTTYEMDYHTNEADGIRDRPGLIKRLDFPTLGYVKWQWQRWDQPGAEGLWPCDYEDPQGCATDFYEDWPGLRQKTYRNRDGSGIGAWTYDTRTCDPAAPETGYFQERQTRVRSPAGDDAVHYFRALPKTPPRGLQYDITRWDFALPFTRRVSVPDSVTGSEVFLSSEGYEGEAEFGNGCEISPGSDKKRSTFVRYAHTWGRRESDDVLMDNAYRAITRHRVAQRTVYHDDQDDGGDDRFLESYWFDFDGHGNFRTTTTAGSFEGASLSKRFTNYNPSVDTLKPRLWSNGGFTNDTRENDFYGEFERIEDPGDHFAGMLPPGEAWILHTHESTEEYAKDAEANISYMQTDFCFDESGKLTRTWVYKDDMRPLSRSPHDVITEYERDNGGNVETTKLRGAENYPIPNPTVISCDTVLQSDPEVWMDFEYEYGTMKTATPKKPDGDSMGFHVHDWDIDLGTGKPWRSRDTAGLATEYEFDPMGRLEWIKPTGGAVDRGSWTQFCYSPATGSILAKVEVLSRGNGNQGECTDVNNLLARTSTTYDDIGRLRAEYTLLPGLTEDGPWNQRLHSYDGMNRKNWVTEWQELNAGVLKKTRYLNFDFLNRATVIRPPDGPSHDVNVEYIGDRMIKTTGSVATSRVGSAVNEEPVLVSTQEFDGLGNLYRLTEPAGPNGEDVTISYNWDVAGRLRKVSIPWGLGTQIRQWTYDGRGFLTEELVPEKGPGTVIYSAHNVRGQAGQIEDGPHTLTYTYDPLGRLESVHDGVDSIRNFGFAAANEEYNGSVVSYCQGKLRQSSAINRVGANQILVDQQVEYFGMDGNISNRKTRIESVLADAPEATCSRSFPIGYEWSELGAIASIDYQLDEGGIPGGEGPESTAPEWMVEYSYDDGFLTGVEKKVDLQTNGLATFSYHPNFMIDRVTYGNNASTVHSKDPDDMARTGKISVYNRWGTKKWDSGNYLYDGVGNIKAMENSFTDPDMYTFTHIYDKIGRIKEWAKLGGSSTISRNYGYDVLGNLETMGAVGFLVDHGTNHISGSDYDDAGNMISWDDISYSYYPTNQLKEMFDPTAWTSIYAYSADGERVARYDNGPGTGDPDGLTYVIRDLNGKPLREYYETGCNFDWQKDWVWRDGLAVAVDDGGGLRYFHLDHLGTPRRITSESGAVVAEHDYYPFGIEIEPADWDGEAVKFTGHERDLANSSTTTEDLDYMHARYYSPQLGRFLSVDPVGGNVGSSQSWNRYSYAQNSPVVFVDPEGRSRVKSIKQFLYKKALNNARRRGVGRAWKLEREMVEKTGSGSTEWTKKQKHELLETGKVKGFEGHHVNSVAANDMAMAEDPANVKFVKGRKEHLQEHDGNFANETSGKLVDRTAGLIVSLLPGAWIVDLVEVGEVGVQYLGNEVEEVLQPLAEITNNKRDEMNTIVNGGN